MSFLIHMRKTHLLHHKLHTVVYVSDQYCQLSFSCLDQTHYLWIERVKDMFELIVA